MTVLEFKAPSMKQIQRLRNLKPIRITKGNGFKIEVDDETANKVKNAFMRGKGIQLKLNADEVERNRTMQGTGLFDGLVRGAKRVFGGIKKDVKNTINKTKRAFRSPKDFVNVATEVGTDAIPFVGDETKDSVRKSVRKTMKGKGSEMKDEMQGEGLQSFLRQSGRTLGRVGRTLGSVAKTPMVSKTLSKLAKTGLELGTDALITSASATAPGFAPVITSGLKAAQQMGNKEIDDAFKKKKNQRQRGTAVSRVGRSLYQGATSVAPQIQEIATETLIRELENRIGSSVNFNSMSGQGIRLSSQQGQGIMLGNGLQNPVGLNGDMYGRMTPMPSSYYQFYPAQRYNT